MKKQKNLLSLLLLVSLSGFAQVGIGTQNPQGIFNIDGAKDNATTGVPTLAQQANDFVISSAGYVGIGTALPKTNLDINSINTGTWVAIANLFAPNNTTAGNNTMINFGVSATQGNSAQFRFVYSGADAATNRVDLGMNGYITPFITYTRNGNVGIGTTAPSEKLEVLGNIKGSGTAILTGVGTADPTEANYAMVISSAGLVRKQEFTDIITRVTDLAGGASSGAVSIPGDGNYEIYINVV